MKPSNFDTGLKSFLSDLHALSAMRIGDVGAVSPIGDLLAFSLAVVIVVSLVYSVGTNERNDTEKSEEDWTDILISVRGWIGFDPDQDGFLELRPPSDLVPESEVEFPVPGIVTVTFNMCDMEYGYRFIDRSLDLDTPEPAHLSIVHGCSVIVETPDGVFPSLMEISVSAGDE